MKNLSPFKLATTILSLMMLTLLTSCFEDINKPEEENDDFDAIIAYDSNNETDYDAFIINSNNQTITLFKTDDTGQITEFDCLIGPEMKHFYASFYENGLPSGFGVDGATLAFSNYEGNKVDIAVIVGDETMLIKDFEAPENWDKIAHQMKFPSPSTRNNDGYDDSTSKAWQYFWSQLANLEELIEDGINAKNPKIMALRFLTNIIKDSSLFFFDTPKEIEYLSFAIDLAIGAASHLTPWGWFFLLVTHYDTFVDFFSYIIENALEGWENFLNNRDNGLGALNSGSGTLKATLTWDFYADIDLHAFEPSGNHIYWENPTSPSGGFLDVDNREGGRGAIENIYWEEPVDGAYDIYIDYYGESIANGLAQCGICTVSIFVNGHGRTFNIMMDADDIKSVTTVTMPNGVLSPNTTVRININRLKKESKVAA